MDEPGLPTLYDWAGGAEALRRFIDAFYDRVEHDELLTAFFPGGVSEEHRAHVSDWWSEVLGGPTTYTDEHGGYEGMLVHHRGLQITPEQRHRFASTMSLAADDAGLPADAEFRAEIIGYVDPPHRIARCTRDSAGTPEKQWGTRLAMHNSQPHAEGVAEHAPVPRWGWGIAPPYTG